jgi:hypothetical protein
LCSMSDVVVDLEGIDIGGDGGGGGGGSDGVVCRL